MPTSTRARRPDRTAVLVSLTAITALAWLLTARFAGGMNMQAAPMNMSLNVSPVGEELVVVAAMWIAMMTGMMVPAAAPMVVAYTAWTRRDPHTGTRMRAVAAFLTGYLLVWGGFSLVAATLQVTLERAGVLTPMGATSRPAAGAAVLVLAGLFQLTRWKESCLRGCRTPTGFLIAQWRDGATGALRMGLRHGAYCLGCCWAMMAVLFVVGTMHLLWMAAIAGVVLAEKVAPAALRVRHATAAGLIGWGSWSLAAGALATTGGG